jgi:hypothetical protein
MMLRIAATVSAVLIMVGTAAAQGRGNGNGRSNPSAVTQTRTTSQPASSPTGHTSPSFPQFGTWLDDATVATRGAGYLSIGASYWQNAGVRQTDAPILGVTYGMSTRAQISATVPFYRATYDGFSRSGLDHVYISGKVAIIDPNVESRRFGMGVSAVAEILSSDFADASQAHWAAPLSLEFRARAIRLYGSTGYFSRGALFAAGALEWTAHTGTSVTASMTHSASARGVTIATTTNVRHASLSDASLVCSHPVTNRMSIYVGGSRTFSDTWIDGASSFNGGISIRFVNPPATVVSSSVSR